MPQKSRRNRTRRNVSKACSFCKARKRKCDGLKPCSFCVKKNIGGSCCYDVLDKRSIRFSHLKRDVIASHAEYKDDLNSTECEDSSDSEPATPWLNIETKLLNFGNHNELAIPTEKSTTNASSWKDNKLNQEENGPSRLLYDNEGSVRFIGESSPLALLSQTRVLFSQVDFSFLINNSHSNYSPTKLKLSKGKFVNDPKRYNFFDAPTTKLNDNTIGIRSLHFTDFRKFPPREDADYMIEMFLQNENQLIYIFNDRFFNSSVNEVFKNPQSASLKAICRLHLVLAIGIIYGMSTNEPPLYNIEKYDHKTHFETAMFLLNNNLDHDGNLWLVEIYMLITCYSQLTSKRNVSWLNLGHAIRIAESLGLNRKDANDLFKDKEYSQHRRKLWRSLYILDRLYSLNLGRPLTINNRTWDERNTILLQLDDHKLTPYSSLRSICEIYLTDLCNLNGQVYEEIYHSDKIDPSTAYKLALNLNKWASSLPKQLKAENLLKFKNNIEEATVSGRFYYLPMLLLHLVHLNGVSLLSRPFFHYYFATNIQKIIKNLKSDSTLFLTPQLDNPDSIIKVFAESCLNSAIFGIKFCSYYLKNKIHPLKPYTLITIVFNFGQIVGLVLLFDLTNLIQAATKSCTQEMVEEVSQKFNLHMKIFKVSNLILKEYAKCDLFAKRYNEILTDMVESIENLLKNAMKVINEQITVSSSGSTTSSSEDHSGGSSLLADKSNDDAHSNISSTEGSSDSFSDWLLNTEIDMQMDRELEFLRSIEFTFPTGDLIINSDQNDRSVPQETQGSAGQFLDIDEMTLFNAFLYNLKETGSGGLNY